MLISLTGNQKILGAFWLCVLMYNFIFKFFPQPSHFPLDLCEYTCGKDIYDNALSNVWKVFQKKTEKTGTSEKKHLTFFGSQSKISTFLKYFKKYQTQTNELFSHYSDFSALMTYLRNSKCKKNSKY